MKRSVARVAYQYVKLRVQVSEFAYPLRELHTHYVKLPVTSRYVN